VKGQPNGASDNPGAASAGPPARRRLVVVSYHFPPDPAIGGMRWAALTKYLGRMGWHSWVVTAAAPGDQWPPNVTVEHRRRRRTLQDMYRLVRGSGPDGRVAHAEAHSTGARSPAQPPWFARFRMEAGLLLALPDEARGWILTAARATRRLIARSRPAAIVSSGPPHSAHLAAWLATRGTMVPWLADLRDPWAGPHAEAWQAEPEIDSALVRWLYPRLERTVFGAATAIVCNTLELASALAGRYPNTLFEWIPNGADPESLKALRLFLDRNPLARAETSFRIAGHIAGRYADRIGSQVADLGLAPWVQLLGVLRRDEALDLVARSRLAVVLSQQQELQVPAKLYEMVLIGIPTVVLASAASAAASEAVRLGATTVTPDNTEALARVMEHAWKAPRQRPKAGTASPASYAEIARRVDTLLGEQLRGGPGSGPTSRRRHDAT
jgi:hypothetical protein